MRQNDPSAPTLAPPTGAPLPFEPSPALVSVPMHNEPELARCHGKRIGILIVTYNAITTLTKVLKRITPSVWENVEEIAVFDDASADDTYELALGIKVQRHLPKLTVLKHEKNLGYGGNQKTCYRAALDRGADIVVMLHPDFQYDARLIPYMTGLIRDGVCDVILGSRIRTRHEALQGGMPLYKYLMNRLLTLCENLVFGIAVSETHTGYRAYSRKALESVPFERNSNDFVFDQQMIAQLVHFHFRIGEIPVPTRYFAEASSISFRRSVVYGIATIGTLIRYVTHRLGVWRYPILDKR